MLLFSLFLGILQGITEFLPVSSSGHLALMENLAFFQEYRHNLEAQVSLLSFNVILHAGTLLAVLFYYRRKLLTLLQGFFAAVSKKKFRGQDMHYILLLFWATLPVLSVPLYKNFVEQATGDLSAIATLFIINAFLLFSGQWLYAYRQKREENIHNNQIQEKKWYNALIVGLFQLLAVFPGISRSGSTISAALGQGVKGEDAVEFSFLMSIPVLAAAILLEAKEVGNSGHLGGDGLLWILLGFATSLLAGWFSLQLLTWLGKKQMFFPFAVYTLLLGIIIKTFV